MSSSADFLVLAGPRVDPIDEEFAAFVPRWPRQKASLLTEERKPAR